MDSPEYNTLTKCYPELLSCIRQAPNDVAHQLMPLDILADSDKIFLKNSTNDDGQKAERIIDIVIMHVEKDPGLLKLIKALSKAGSWTKAIVDKLKQTYSGITGHSQSLPEINGSSHTSNAQLHQDTLKSDPSHNQAARSLYQVAVEKSTIKSKFDIKGRCLERETTKIRGKFAGLIIDIISSISEKGITVKSFLTFLKEIKYVSASLTTATDPKLFFTPKVLHEIKTTCSDIDDIFSKLEGYYSWFNFDLIEVIVATFCEEVNQKLSRYKANLKKYCRNRLCLLPDLLIGEHSENFTLCIFKVDKEWEMIRVSEVQIVMSIICEILEIDPIAFLFRAACNGCIELTIDIPKHIAAAVLPPSPVQAEALKEHGIQYITCSESFLYM